MLTDRHDRHAPGRTPRFDVCCDLSRSWPVQKVCREEYIKALEVFRKVV